MSWNRILNAKELYEVGYRTKALWAGGKITRLYLENIYDYWPYDQASIYPDTLMELHILQESYCGEELTLNDFY